MTVTCIGHSGMAVEVGDVTLIFDYYIDPAGVLDDILARARRLYVIDLNAYRIAWLHHDEDWSDDRLAIHAYDSTDVGVGFLVDVDGRRIYHAGDYTCWHFSEEQDTQAVRKARGDFHAILNRIVAHSPHIDLAMMPVVPNIGGDWAYGPREFLRAISVDTFIPIHTWGRDREATQFALYQNPAHGQCIHLQPGQTLKKSELP